MTSRIIVDMDGILADFIGGLRDSVARYGATIDEEKITDFFKIEDGVSRPLPVSIKSLFHQKGFFRYLPVLPGAQSALKTLSEEGHEVIIATTPAAPSSAFEKIEWFAEHFDFLDQKSLVVIHKKHLLRGDVLIDDGTHNAVGFLEANPDAFVTTLAYAYNDSPRYHFRGKDWPELVAAIAQRRV